MALTKSKIEKLKAEARREFEEMAPQIRAEYGELSDSKVGEVIRAYRELEMCAKCDGVNCCKESGKYNIPVIEKDKAWGLYIAYAVCNPGIGRLLRQKYKRFGIPELYADKTFEDYEVTGANDDAVALAKWFLARKPEVSLYYYGSCGSGKTYLASLIAREYLLSNRSVVFGDVPYLMEEIKRTFDKSTESTQDILNKYSEADLLVLDDMGAGVISGWSVGILYQIINRRYNGRKAAIITSNYDLKGLGKVLSRGDVMTAERIMSRLSAMVKVAGLGRVDRRQEG